jgi:hypothetical protein
VEDTDGKSRNLLQGLHELMLDESSLPFGDFVEAAEAFIDSYAKFVRRGMPAPTIGLAMLGATVNMYEMFGTTDQLPDLLRIVADKIERDGRLH